MSFSPGPFITCFLTALVLNIYILFIIHVKKDILYEGMRFTFGVIVLILLRMMIPLNFPFTITIPFAKVFPGISNVLYYNIGDSRVEVFHVLIIIWLTGAVIQMLRVVNGNREYKRFLAPFKVKDISEYPEIMEMLREYNLPDLPVYIVPASVSPELFGARHTALVLPEDILSHKEELKFSCRHELEHYKSHDLWLKMFVDLALCIQWFNPLVYILQKELILAFEMANDRKVMHGCTEKQRMEYALGIIRVSRTLKNGSVKQRGLSFARVEDNNTKQRIMFLQSPDYGKTKRKGISIFLRYVLVIAMLVVSFVYVPEGYYSENIEDSGAVKVHEENSFLVKCEEGYKWYTDGIYMYTFAEIHEGFDELPIFEEEELK